MRVFFGAGRIGGRAQEIWKYCGLSIDYFCDNNAASIGKKIDGVEIIELSRLLTCSSELEIYVTCKDAERVVQQLQLAGVQEEQIRICNTLSRMFVNAMCLPEFNFSIDQRSAGMHRDEVHSLFDLSYGLALGGVESWAIRSQKKLEELGWKASILTDPQMNPQQKVNSSKILAYHFEKSENDVEKVKELLRLMTGYRKVNIVCNFDGNVLISACIAKKLYADQVQVIAVVHNDELCYYQEYLQMEEYIDKCLVISDRIKQNMIDQGFPERKLAYLPWEIECDKEFEHAYSKINESIRIGYAGRIVLNQKRMDYLIDVANRLKKQGIKFVIELAGTGSFLEELEDLIKKYELHNNMICIGMIPQKKINEFWQHQDIMISCSDYEGHSISQVEAMASGAVPVITDTSGARDDVIDGENGFVVEVGAVDQLVERIVFLYNHRALLPIMGLRAYQTIKENNSGSELEKLWNQILIK